MDEALKAEFGELQNLQATGSLDESQQTRLTELNSLNEQAEKTVKDEQIKKDLESALAQKEHFRNKAKEAEAEKVALEDRLKKASRTKNSLEVDDYIDISASLEGLDMKEKEFISEQHKLSGKPLREIRNDENFLLWQSAYRQKVEKEKLALKPSGSAIETDVPRSFEEKLKGATSLVEKEKMLTEAGLYKSPKQNPNRVAIGGMR